MGTRPIAHVSAIEPVRVNVNEAITGRLSGTANLVRNDTWP